MTITQSITLEIVKLSHEYDYSRYQIEKNGSLLKNIADSHFLLAGTLLGIGIYQNIKNKNMLLPERLPQLLIQTSAGYLGEQFIKFLGRREEQNAKKNSTINYSILKNCFEILEKKEKMAEIEPTAFLEEYDSHHNEATEEIYNKIKKIFFQIMILLIQKE